MMQLVAGKTWEVTQCIVYNTDGDAAFECSKLLYLIKQVFIGGTVPWVVKGSSSSTEAGMDNVDRWTDRSKLVWASSGAHSWIVFEIPNLDPGANNVQVCFDLLNSNRAYFNAYLSPAAGFTGGSTTARPTATDEGTAIFSGQWMWPDQTSSTAYVCKSTDGQCNRVFISYNNTSLACWMFDRIKNPHADIVRPYYTFMLYDSAGPNWNSFFNSNYIYARLGATANERSDMRATTMVYNTTSPVRESEGGHGRAYDGNNYVFPIGLFWPKTSSLVDHMRAGEMFDFWITGSYGLQFDYIRGVGGAYKMIRVGDGFIQPGDGLTEWWRIG